MSDTKKAVVISDTHLITPEARLSFPVLFTPRPYFDKGDQFQATLLFPPGTDFAPFYEALKKAMLDKFGQLVPMGPAANPLKDAAEKSQFAGYEAGWKFLAMHTPDRVAVVDQTKTPVTDPAKCYPGQWVRAHINAFGWAYKGKKGVSFGLNAIQIVRDGDRLDGRITTGDAFDPLDLGDIDGPGHAATAPGGASADLNSLFG